jgi:cysteine-S-conjugate beta-lyase
MNYQKKGVRQMKNNFDQEVDRSHVYDRHWNTQELEKNYHINPQKEIFSFWIGDHDFAVPPKVYQALKTRLETRVYGYSYLPSEFYQIVQKWNQDLFNCHYEAEDILLTYGTIPAIYSFVQAFTKKGDAILINTPVYGPFGEAILENERRLVKNKLIYQDQNFLLDFDLLEKQIQENKVKAYIFCNPHNPGGHLWSKSDLRKIVELCQKYKVILFSDEVHRDIIYRHQTFVSMGQFHQAYQQIIVATSPNKAFNFGGLKTGYLLIPDSKVRTKMVQQLKLSRVTSPNTFGAIALIAAYQSRDWLIEFNHYLEENFNYLKSQLIKFAQQIEIFETQSSFFAYLNFAKSHCDWLDFKKIMEKNNIILAYGDSFVDDGFDFVRINLGTSHAKFKRFVQQLIRALDEVVIYGKNHE